ncbi:hypothetical protein [Flammeovirga aprica]|uniref:Uncharacterized protein n=1 Tax=Flammeovirga aprica JL-4 TaxID=694437 RepID=A0A7X9RSW5_9BACT|nr:hypothetical protein [Flammeovirga aprica]NME66482.1 hypothetical protein [Flammeovirga aprica JL-4]
MKNKKLILSPFIITNAFVGEIKVIQFIKNTYSSLVGQITTLTKAYDNDLKISTAYKDSSQEIVTAIVVSSLLPILLEVDSDGNQINFHESNSSQKMEEVIRS